MSSNLLHHPGLRILIITAAAMFFLSCGNNEPPYTSQDVQNFHKWLDTDQKSPTELITAAHDSGLTVILSQDNPMRADTVDLAKSLLPSLYDLGLREWGVFFLDSKYQDEVDSLITDRKSLNESASLKAAENLLFKADASLGYREYRDFILYIRDFNRYLAPEEEPIKLLALSSNRMLHPSILPSAAPDPNTPASETQETSTEAEESSNGNPDEAAESIEPFPGILWIKADDVPQLKDFTGITNTYVIAHSLPRNDIIGIESTRRDIRDRSFAFEPASLPFGGWDATQSEISADLVIVTPFAFRTVSQIEDFITESSSTKAAEDFPEIRLKTPSSSAAARMNRLLKKRSIDYRKTIEKDFS